MTNQPIILRAPEEGPAFSGLTLMHLDECFSCRQSIWDCHEMRLDGDTEGCCEDCDHYTVADPGAHLAATLRHLNESALF